MKIIVKIKNVFGNELIYPICDKAKLFVKMVNQKTLTKHDLIIIVQLGFEIKELNESNLQKLLED